MLQDGNGLLNGTTSGVFYRLNLTGAPTISSLTAVATVGVPVSIPLLTTGGNVLLSASGLPSGLEVSSPSYDTEYDFHTGLISGKASTPGTYQVTIKATNSLGSATGALTLTVNPAR